MEFNQIVEQCRTIHSYDPKAEVADAWVQEALELSLTAPNHKLTFPWHYIWVGPQTRQRLAEISVQMSAAKMQSKGRDMSQEEREDARAKFMAASHLIAFCCKRTADDFTARENYATLSCSVQIFALSLARHGVGYKWATGAVSTHAKSYEVLGVDPAQDEIIGFMWVGKGLKAPGPRQRPELGQVLKRLS